MQRTLTGPELALIAGTRVALGVGLGLLFSGRLTREQSKAAGVALIAVGALTSIPLAIQVIAAKSTDKRTLQAA